MSKKKYTYLLLLVLIFPLNACFSSENKTKPTEPIDNGNEKPELIYVYDPLCGWCYGFSPVMQKLKENYQDKLHFTIYSGGLAIGQNAKPVKEGFGFIKNASRGVTEETGVAFGKPFIDLIDEGSYIYNSEPPCVALTVFKSMKPEDAFSFAHEMQKDFFKEGKSLNDTATYLALVKKFDVNPDAFLKKFSDEDYKKQTYKEFEKATEIGANGFPTVILKNGGKYKVLLSGYQDYETLSKIIDKNLK